MSKFVEKILQEYFLKEGKNIGTLYHFTSLMNLKKILSTNTIKSYPQQHSDLYCFSVTRDKNFHLTADRTGDVGVVGVSCRIALDGNKISQNYKIKPHNWYYYQDGDTRPNTTESEEVIITKKNGGLINLKKYVINIAIFPSVDSIAIYYSKEKLDFILIPVLKELEKSNIPFKIEK